MQRFFYPKPFIASIFQSPSPLERAGVRFSKYFLSSQILLICTDCFLLFIFFSSQILLICTDCFLIEDFIHFDFYASIFKSPYPPERNGVKFFVRIYFMKELFPLLYFVHYFLMYSIPLQLLQNLRIMDADFLPYFLALDEIVRLQKMDVLLVLQFLPI
jgi:hypothetical protein